MPRELAPMPQRAGPAIECSFCDKTAKDALGLFSSAKRIDVMICSDCVGKFAAALQAMCSAIAEDGDTTTQWPDA